MKACFPSIDWKQQTFKSLEEAWHDGKSGPGSRDDNDALINRYAQIIHMAARDGIWPLSESIARNRFFAALREVLSRLPQDAFNKVNQNVRFVLDDPSLKMLALNAPAPPTSNLSSGQGIDTVIFFHKCLELSQKSLIGLIAYELAHTFRCDEDYFKDENLAGQLTREWGFAVELDCLEAEKEKLYSTKPASTIIPSLPATNNGIFKKPAPKMTKENRV